ncbi:MAG: DUF4266 domain-containing protein [Deltaproteobacteria bacterium]|nr:DUF4266 domain-containing protein [Deltaproteobacteria bacterium]
MTALLAIGALVAGCAHVKPWQRERLAKAKMQLSGDAQATELEQHVYESREGSAGGTGGAGGGCGCN